MHGANPAKLSLQELTDGPSESNVVLGERKYQIAIKSMTAIEYIGQTDPKHRTQKNENGARPANQKVKVDESVDRPGYQWLHLSFIGQLGRAANPLAVSLRGFASCPVLVQMAACCSRATGLVAHIPQNWH